MKLQSDTASHSLMNWLSASVPTGKDISNNLGAIILKQELLLYIDLERVVKLK